ncbi:MAG: HPF/RaiA family ribosome-associated protein [bacterium]|nr:HPF/RaiA family ribosome-associated protein [bacterium]
MNIQIIADNLVLSAGNRLLIDEKINNALEKLLTHYSPEQKIASVKVQKDKYDKYTINFDMNLAGNNIYAQTSHILFESALVDLIDAIEKQIKKLKEN